MKVESEWWICRDGHAKMLSERRPVCPVCYVIMELMPAEETETKGQSETEREQRPKWQ